MRTDIVLHQLSVREDWWKATSRWLVRVVAFDARGPAVSRIAGRKLFFGDADVMISIRHS